MAIPLYKRSALIGKYDQVIKETTELKKKMVRILEESREYNFTSAEAAIAAVNADMKDLIEVLHNMKTKV